MSGRSFLIGLDGATFDVLDPIMQEGVMPALREFIGGGVRADLRTVVPALTPPAWTSLMTGRSPGHHGIFDFFTKESPDSYYFHVSSAQDVRAETLWSIANREGRRCTILNFPMTFPAPDVQGNVVPGWMPWRQLRLGCRPADLFDRIKKLPGFEARELSMDLSPEAKAVQGCRLEELEEWVSFYIRRERQWLRIVEMLEREDPSDLTAILFDGVDKIQHLCWRFIDPAYRSPEPSEREARIRSLCLEYYRQLDEILARIFAMSGPGDTTFIASDHGFGAQTGTFFVNSWLEKQGYLAWAKDAGPEAGGSGDLGMEQLARHVYLLDWEKTRAYVPTPSGNGIYIVRSGMSSSEYEDLRAALVRDLREVRDENGVPVVSRIFTSDEVFSGPCQDLSPDVTVELRDGGLVSILDSDAVFRTRAEPIGAHRPQGVFLARGPGYRKGAKVEELSILDVAPSILHGLGLPIPADFEGRVPVEAMAPGFRERERAASVPAPDAVAAERSSRASRASRASRPKLSQDDEKRLAAHLRALGYLE
jgi:predicted AlkP superfamily phosphohydrolase/phosphomutase